MTHKIPLSAVPDFDPAEHLKDEEDIACYLTLVLEDGDPSELAHALGVVARARGMTELAKLSGITREALFESLHLDTPPCFEIINQVYQACGVKIPLAR
ncbi:putative addiction module antidote protein [Chromatium weissei]|nr:putative addiction module antidote protein [Chromatium weissei]